MLTNNFAKKNFTQNKMLVERLVLDIIVKFYIIGENI